MNEHKAAKPRGLHKQMWNVTTPHLPKDDALPLKDVVILGGSSDTLGGIILQAFKVSHESPSGRSAHDVQLFGNLKLELSGNVCWGNCTAIACLQKGITAPPPIYSSCKFKFFLFQTFAIFPAFIQNMFYFFKK